MANKTSKQGKNAKKNTEKKVVQTAPKSPIIDDKSLKATEKAAEKAEKAVKKTERSVDKTSRPSDKKDTKDVKPSDKKEVKATDKKDGKPSDKVTKATDKKDARLTDKKAAKDAKASEKSEKKAAKNSKKEQKKPSIFKRILTYFKNVRLEIKRTTWPTRNEVFRMSLIVIGALLFFGVFIFIMDWVMTKLLEFYSTLAVKSTPEGGFPLLSNLYSSTFFSMK